MGEVSYAPIISEMTWSYSRVRSFHDCPYRWYLRYIRGLKGKDLFFASYGSFMHKLIEMFLKNEKTAVQLKDIYLQEFRSKVVNGAPSYKVFSNYFLSGLKYIEELKTPEYNVVGIEKQIKFKLDDIPVLGYIDILGKKDNEILIVDNKSKILKSRSKRKKPTQTDRELDEYLRQLYLYSTAIEQEYGKLPTALCFNCFRAPSLIKEPFDKQKYEEAKQWFADSVEQITNETDFKPDMEFFKCKYLCEMQDYCEYYNMTFKR